MFTNFFQSILEVWTVLIKYKPYFIDGAKYTILLAFCTVICGSALALVLVLMNLSKSKILSFIAKTYIEIFRCTPILVQLMLIYFGVFGSITIPRIVLFGFLDLSMFIPGVVTLGLNSAAYVAEIIRAGILAVDGGQGEAARSLGLSGTQAMCFVILPQAIKNILPAIANEFVVIIKESSVCMFMGIRDLMGAAALVVGASFKPVAPYIIVALVYFALTFPTSKIIGHFERRMRRGDVR